MRIVEIPFEEADWRSIARVILEARQAAGYWDSGMEVSRVEEILSQNFEGLKVRLILAEEAAQISGLVLMKVNEDNTAEINPWFLGGLPIVSPSANNADGIAIALLEKALQSARSLGGSRVESLFSQDAYTESIEAMLKANDMVLVEEIEHLRSPLGELDFSAPEIPEGFHLVGLSEIDRTELLSCWCKTFIAGEDRSFLSRSKEERESFFDDSFDFSKEWTEEASLAIVAEEGPIAFALVRPTHGKDNAHLWEFGVHPDHRRTGLAKGLLKLVCKKLIELGFRTFSLNVDVGNYSAYNLYKKLGFKREWGLICYAWMAKR